MQAQTILCVVVLASGPSPSLSFSEPSCYHPHTYQSATGITLDFLVGQREDWQPGMDDKKDTCHLRAEVASPSTATLDR